MGETMDMITDYNLQFIEQKLTEAKTAVMYTDGNNVVKLPNDVVTFLKLDESGRLWLTAHKPRCLLGEYEPCFPLRLIFYRKGIGFSIEATGIGTIAGNDDINEVREDVSDAVYLIKMKPHLVEYTEFGKKYLFPGLMQMWNSFLKWMSNSFSSFNTKSIPLTGIEKTKHYG
jgi:hypothetical protein